MPPTLLYASTSICLDLLHNQISIVPGWDGIDIITTQISHVRTARMLSLGLLPEYRTKYKIGICIFPFYGLHVADPKKDLPKVTVMPCAFGWHHSACHWTAVWNPRLFWSMYGMFMSFTSKRHVYDLIRIIHAHTLRKYILFLHRRRFQDPHFAIGLVYTHQCSASKPLRKNWTPPCRHGIWGLPVTRSAVDGRQPIQIASCVTAFGWRLKLCTEELYQKWHYTA